MLILRPESDLVIEHLPFTHIDLRLIFGTAETKIMLILYH